MSPLLSHALQAMPSTFGTAWFTLMARRIANVRAARRRRAAQRRDLQSLDEHALRDIGHERAPGRSSLRRLPHPLFNPASNHA